jgi:bidirectional [NiFe] hydrogenase diaphorase subunit
MAITVTIDDQKISVPEGATLLDAAKKAGIEIPTLCYREGIEPYCVCRVCTVEIGWPDGWRKLTAACSMKAKDGILMWTDSENVRKVRKMMIELTLARVPENAEVRQLAAKYGVDAPRFEGTVEPGDCILCGLCVDVCHKVGADAITFKNRGYERLLTTPFDEPSRTCIGCFACANVCPTNHIVTEEEDGVRKIWGREFPMHACDACGKMIITKAQVEHYSGHNGFRPDDFALCDECHRKRTADNVKELMTF